MEQSDISGRLRKALEAAELTQSQLAEKLTLSSAAVSQWLSGKKEPGGKALREAASILSIDPAWLEYGAGTPPTVNLQKQRIKYETAAGWVFRRTPEDGGRDYGNANLWSIPWDIETLAKEGLQNSVDAAVDPTAGVEVGINLIRLTGHDLDKFLTALKWSASPLGIGLGEHIQKSSENSQKLGTILRDGLESLARDRELILLRIDDFRTRGLVGPEDGIGNFAALCRNNLDSQKQNSVAGGAYGLGKAVFWRASRFSTVLFCSNLSEPFVGDDNAVQQDLRVIGKADLAWHQIDGSDYAGPGWFGLSVKGQDGKQIRANSMWNNQALAQDLYLDRGDAVGTSILVIGFQDASSDAVRSLNDIAEEFERAVSKNFWPALLSGRLSVNINIYEGRIQRSSISVDPTRYHASLVDAVRKYRRGEISEKLKNEGDVVVKQIPLNIPKRNRDPKHQSMTDESVLLVRRASDDAQGEDINQVAYYRGQEMIIMYQNLKMLVSGGVPFNAVVLCGRASGQSESDTAAEHFLRSAEPPAHDRWVITPELKIDYAPGSRTNLEAFFRRVKEEIREVVKPTFENLDDGPRALKELLRVCTTNGASAVDAPRVIIDQRRTSVTGSGSWQVFVRIKLPDDRSWRIVPTLLFAAESGGGKRVSWNIKPVSGCSIDGDTVVSAPSSREMQFIGNSDPSTHPAPASDSAVSVVLQHVQPEAR